LLSIPQPYLLLFFLSLGGLGVWPKWLPLFFFGRGVGGLPTFCSSTSLSLEFMIDGKAVDEIVGVGVGMGEVVATMLGVADITISGNGDSITGGDTCSTLGPDEDD
jgi:hypothetical protein